MEPTFQNDVGRVTLEVDSERGYTEHELIQDSALPGMEFRWRPLVTMKKPEKIPFALFCGASQQTIRKQSKRNRVQNGRK